MMAEKDRSLDDSPTQRQRAPDSERLQSALEKAANYREGEDIEDDPSADPVRPMEEWRDIVSQRIDDAMRQGLFDNLSGRGKPLDLRRDPFVPEDQQMAVTLLRNNGLTPEWISERKELLAAIANLRADLLAAVQAMQPEWQSASDERLRDRMRDHWSARLRSWRTRLESVNRRILVHNLKQPVAHLEILMLRAPDELARAGARPEWEQDPAAD